MGRIYSFLDSSKQFSVNYFNAQPLLHEVQLLQHLPGSLLAQFHGPSLHGLYLKSLLTYPLLSVLTKGQEELGLYLDLTAPKLRFKWEFYQQKYMRCIIVAPESEPHENDNHHQFHFLNGLARLVKFSALKGSSYESVVELSALESDAVFSTLLKDSYQLDAAIYLDPTTFQSIFLYKLPPKLSNMAMALGVSAEQQLQSYVQEYQQFLAKEHHAYDVVNIVKGLESLGHEYLKCKTLTFKCRCSRENFKKSLSQLSNETMLELLAEKNSFTTECDYCRTTYDFTKDDLLSNIT